MPSSCRARRAPSTRPSMTFSCHWAAITATRRSPQLRTDSSGAPLPLTFLLSASDVRAGCVAAAVLTGCRRSDGGPAVVQPGQVVPHPVPLGAQIAQVVLARLDGHRLTAGDREAVPDERGGLVGVVGHQPDAAHAEVVEDLRRPPRSRGRRRAGRAPGWRRGCRGRAPGVRTRAAWTAVRCRGPRGRADRRRRPGPRPGDALQGGLQLGAAVAAQRVEDVAGQALGVDADEDVLAVADVAVDERDVLDAVDGGAVAVRGERRRRRWAVGSRPRAGRSARRLRR